MTLASELARERARQIQSGEVSPGLSTGIPKLDEMIGALGPVLHVIGGLPGGGKSSFLLQLVLSVGEQNGQLPYLWSGEDSVNNTMDRVLANLSGIPAQVLGSGLATAEQAAMAAEASCQVRNWRLDDTAGSAREICQRIWDVKDSVSCVMVDYAQVVTPSRYSVLPDSKDHVVEVVRTFAALSKALDKPVLLGSQFTKAAEERGPRRLRESRDKGQPDDWSGYTPSRYDLHGSGDLIKIAKCILLVNAPGVWNSDPTERNKFDVHCVKDNFGDGAGRFVRLHWTPELGRIQ